MYISRWANTLGVSAQALTEQVQSLWRRRKAGERKKRDGDLTLASQDVEVNRRDPQRARNIGYALAEDKLIAALWKNNDFYPFIKERIRPEDFVTDSNRVIFQELCRRLEENRPVTVTAFASVLDEALLSGSPGFWPTMTRCASTGSRSRTSLIRYDPASSKRTPLR